MATKKLGIDLGTCTIVVAELDSGSVKVTRTFPALYNLANEKIGEEAETPEMDPKNLVREVKKFMGIDPDIASAIYKEAKHQARQKGNRFETPDGKRIAPEVIAAKFLQKIKDQYPEKTEFQVVVTVPAHYGEAQRKATKDSTELAGLKLEALINEPTAATLAYAENFPVGAKICTTDFGGGTLDVSILEKTAEGLKVRGTAGDPNLGGAELDNLLVTWAISRFRKNSSIFKEPNPETMNRLKHAARECKHRLSSTDSATVEVVYNDIGSIATTVTRAEFERVVRPTITRLTTHLYEALEEANLKASEIDSLAFIGGSSKIPLVREIVKEEFPGATEIPDIDADKAVAIGAAYYLKSITRTELELSTETAVAKVQEINTQTLGIETIGDGFSPIIHKGSPIPTTKTGKYETTCDFQKAVSIKILRGDNPKASQNELLGVFQLAVLPMPKGETQLAVKFTMDESGLLTVTAIELTGTNQTRTVSIKSTRPGNLTEEELRIAKSQIAE